VSRRTAAALATGLLVASVVVSSPALAAPVKKACALVRPSELSAQFADAAVEKGPKPPGPPTATTCMWVVGTGTPGGGSVALFLQRGSEAKNGYTLAKRQFADGATELTGLGRKAFEAGDVVWVLKGKTLFYVQGLFYGDGKPVDLVDRLVALARLAHDRV
jgi:hypothetical protein